MYSNEAERPHQDIYDDFKLKKKLNCGLCENIVVARHNLEGEN